MKLTLENQFLAKEMTRKQFLQYVFAGFLAVMGVANLLASLKNTFSAPQRVATAAEEPKKTGFGTSKFGV
ncbi:MAG: hypothetical protein WBP26_03785 [Candidatus Saccharimonadales bacterium]